MKKQYSLWSIAFIFAFVITLFFTFHIWKKNRIIIDAPSYYTYLPATFIYGDLHLNFIDNDPPFFKNKIWYYKIEEGKRLIKHPAGISVALSPFFLAGHLVAKVTGGRQDGYSLCYQNALSIGVLIYLLIGLFYLRKLLLNYFTDPVVALTILVLVIGTNLLWYSSFEGLMPHAISFSILCICLFHFYEWLKEGSHKHLLMFAALFGLSILIRPLALSILLYFLAVAIVAKGGFRNFYDFISPQVKNIIIAVLITGSIASVQMMYWKYATGHWLYDVYIDEHFVFSSPQMFLFLFSFRKGVFVYTPVLIFAIIGLIMLYRMQRAIFYGTLLTMIITVFLLSSWWAWSYGICWGMRPMIDYYSLLSIPLAAGFSFVFSKSRWIRIIFSIIIFLLVCLNLFQTWQYKNGLIHYDDMTRAAYFKGFFQTKPSAEWQDLLRPYDWERRIKGFPQVEYTKEYLVKSFSENDIQLRAFNLQYVTINPRAQNAIAAYSREPGTLSTFIVVPFGDGTYAFLSMDHKYLSVKQEYKNVLLADADEAGMYERFELIFIDEDDNRIALRSRGNGKYVRTGNEFPNMLFADGNEITKPGTFRLFIVEKINFKRQSIVE
jgi:hypothetical protein